MIHCRAKVAEGASDQCLRREGKQEELEKDADFKACNAGNGGEAHAQENFRVIACTERKGVCRYMEM